VSRISTHLISYGLLNPDEQEYLTHPNLLTSQKRQKLCGILLTLDESGIKNFLKCLSETSDYDPHKELLEMIQGTYKHLSVYL